MKNFKKNFFLLVKMSLLFISCYLVLKNLNNEENLINLKNQLDLKYSLIIFVLLIMATHLQIYITLNTIILKLEKKIKFTYFSRIFFNSQIISTILPHSGLLYRAFHLKKLNLSYTDFVGINYFLAWFYLFYFLIFYSIEILIFGHDFENYKYLLFFLGVATSFGIYLIPFIFFLIPRINFKKDIVKKIYEKIRYIFLIPLEFKKNKFFRFLSIYGLIGHIINFLLIYVVIESTNINLSLNQIIIFFVINSFLDQVPIVPKNFGVSELAFGLVSSNMGLGFETGLFIKLVLRFFSFINLILFSVIYNLISTKE
jgi:uncharacterized membrane protein YbhN (UPF0104 family)